MTNPGGADEELIIKVTAQAQEALDDLTQLRTEVQKIKQELYTVSQQTGESFKVVGESIRETAELTERETRALGIAVRELSGEASRAAQGEASRASVTNKGYVDSSKAAEQYRQKIAEITKQLELLKRQGFSTQEAVQGLVRSGQFNATDVNAAVTSMTSSFQNLGSVASFVFGSVIGITAITAIRNLIGYMQQSVEKGQDFTRAIFNIGLAVNSLRREGLDITFQELSEQIDMLAEKYKFVSETAITQTVSQVAFLTRELGLNKDQMQLVTETALALSAVLGKDASESARQIAQAISSGYSEALQKAGLNINRVTIAQEAYRLGLVKTRTDITKLTEEVKAQAVLSLIEDQMRDLFPDLIQYLNTTTGRISEAQGSFEDLSRTLGTRLLPIWAELVSFFGRAAEGLIYIIDTLAKLDVIFARSALYARAWVDALIESARSGRDFNEVLKELRAEADKEIELMIKLNFPEEFGLLGQTGLGVPGTADYEQKLQEVYDSLREAIEREEQKLNDRLEDLKRDLQNDLERIERRGAQRRLKILRDYDNKVAKLEREFAYDRAKAARDLANDLADIEREYQQDIQDAREDFRQGEIDAEEKYQAELRKLRDEYVFDLEEAVRTRDAVQVRTLTRRFLFERDQLGKEFEDERTERQRNFEQELEDLRRQRDRKLQIRREEYQQTIAEIAISERIAREEAQIQRDQALNELQISLAEETEERKIRYQEQIEDAKKATEDRLEIIANGLINEYELTAENADAIYDLLQEYFGENGLVDSVYIGMRLRIAETLTQIVADTVQILSGLSSFGAGAFGFDLSNSPPIPPGLNNDEGTYTPPGEPSIDDFFGFPGAPGFAQGGSVIANKPTMALFGEAGLEMATFTPLRGSGVRGQNSLNDITRGQRESRIILEVDLSRDLLVKTKDELANELADVIFQVNELRR